MDKITFIDLFCGMGGFHLAFQDLGAECVMACDIDKFARKTYEANFHMAPAHDVAKLKASDIPDHDVLCGGFPCQPFSYAGKRLGFEDENRGNMFFEVLRIIKEKRPKAVFLENVKGLVTLDGGRTIKTVMQCLDGAGYDVTAKVLNAADFGLAQRRERVFIVGFRSDVDRSGFAFPAPTGPVVHIGEILEPLDTPGFEISEYSIKHRIMKKRDKSSNQALVVDDKSKGTSKTLVARYTALDVWTGTYVRGGKTGVRKLTITECKRLQGFPDDFKMPVSNSQAYKQLGNSVAVPVVRAIARNIVNALKGKDYVENEESSKAQACFAF